MRVFAQVASSFVCRLQQLPEVTPISIPRLDAETHIDLLQVPRRTILIDVLHLTDEGFSFVQKESKVVKSNQTKRARRKYVASEAYKCAAGHILEKHLTAENHGDVCRSNTGGVFTCPSGCEYTNRRKRPYCRWMGTDTTCHESTRPHDDSEALKKLYEERQRKADPVGRKGERAMNNVSAKVIINDAAFTELRAMAQEEEFAELRVLAQEVVSEDPRSEFVRGSSEEQTPSKPSKQITQQSLPSNSQGRETDKLVPDEQLQLGEFMVSPKYSALRKRSMLALGIVAWIIAIVVFTSRFVDRNRCLTQSPLPKDEKDGEGEFGNEAESGICAGRHTFGRCIARCNRRVAQPEPQPAGKLPKSFLAPWKGPSVPQAAGLSSGRLGLPQ